MVAVLIDRDLTFKSLSIVYKNVQRNKQTHIQLDNLTIPDIKILSRVKT